MFYNLRVLGLERKLPILKAPSGIFIAGFNPVGDMELLEKAGVDLANKLLSNNINFDIDLKKMYTENEKEMILDAIDRFSDEKVSAIKKVMPDYVKYESIRAVILERYLK